MTTPFHLQISNHPINLYSMFVSQKIYLYPYGRYAFFNLLKALNIKSIYMPSFICRDMLSPISTLKLKCFFYELDQQFKPIKLEEKCDAILFVNYFGFSTDITPFEEYKKKYNAILIEDNAHGFLSKDQQGRWLGTRGDFGIFSIRKTIALPNGAMLSINNQDFFTHIFEEAKIAQTNEDRKYIQKQRIKSLSPYLAFALMSARRLWRKYRSGSHIPPEDSLSETLLPSNQYLTPFLKEGEVNIDIEKEINRRRVMFYEISKIAEKHKISPLLELYSECSPYVFPFIDCEYTRKFEGEIFKKGFFVLPWPSLPSHIDTIDHWYQKIRVVSFLW